MPDSTSQLPPDPANPDAPTGPGLFHRLGPAAILGIAWAFLPAVIGLTLFFKYRGPFADWIKSHGDLAPLIYTAIFAAGAGLGLCPTWVLAAIGGYAFGLWQGFAWALIGFGAASLIGYAVARVVARHRVEGEIDAHPKAKAVRDALVGRGWLKTLGMVTLVRVPPSSPFALMNGVMAATQVPVSAYLIGTLAGMAPRTLAYVFIGTQISGMDDLSKPKWLVWGGLAITFAIIILIGQIANKAVAKVTGETPGGTGVPPVS